MRNLLFILPLFLLPYAADAQSADPFKSIGKHTEVLTLSDGKYQETFDDDVLQRIGSVIIDRHTKKIVQLLDADSVANEVSDNSTSSRWYSIDPLAEKYPSMSPYAFCNNNPILYVDMDGREPIKRQAGTVSGFVAFLNNTTTKMGTLMGANAENAMYRLAKIDWSGGKPTPATTAPFNLQKDRYIYTENGGWIDMAHFMFYAGKAYDYKSKKQAAQAILNGEKPQREISVENMGQLTNMARMDPVGEAVQDGYQQEITDKIFAKWSSYSYEDLPTDKYAADFGANFFDPNSELTLGEQIQNYLNNNLKATTPDKAPNYSNLPTVEPMEQPSRTNKTTTPVYTKKNP